MREKELSVCERCGSSIDVALIYVNDVPVTYCQSCRSALFTQKKPVGRPSIGITKKVSLTLTKDDWTALEEKAKGNRSLFLRQTIVKALDNEESPAGELYFKSDLHKEQTLKILNVFNQLNISSDLYYGCLAYVVGATYKADCLIKAIDEDKTVNIDRLYKSMEVLSHSERVMIRFGLQLFNSNMDDIKLSDVMQSLDSDNIKVIKQAIDLFY